MNLSTAVLGTTAVKHLTATSAATILEVGSDRLTRAQLAGVSCFNFLAATRLTRVLKDLGVKNLADLYARIPPAALALPQLGVVSLAVLGAAFEAKGIGGEAPLESWARKHAGAAEEIVTFDTVKARERQREAAVTRQARRTRAGARAARIARLKASHAPRAAGWA